MFHHCSKKWALAWLLALALPVLAYGTPLENPPVPSVCGLGGDTLASTCRFTTANADRSGVPISARTDFIDNWDSSGWSGLTLATHELFHAIGFAVAYGNFASNLFETPGAGNNPPPAGSRVYSTNGLVGGILLVLTPSANGTHADPLATGAAPWPATGYNQANDIMQPELPKNTVRTLSDVDFDVLDDAFGWGTTGIKIVINNVGGTMDDTDMDILADAAAAITAHFGSFLNSPTFVWDVAEAVPEPSTWIFLSAGLVVFAAARRLKAVR